MRYTVPLTVTFLMCFNAGCDGETIVAPGPDVSTAHADTLRADDVSLAEGSSEDTGPEADAEESVVCPPSLPYTSEVVSFEPGINAGTGQAEMPDIVLGPPAIGGSGSGSLDVLSLGVGGEIILSFGDRSIIDGEGPDFVIWENPFWIGGDPENPFAELGEVSVSLDGESWEVYPCDPSREVGFDAGCAGWRPRQVFDPCKVIPIVEEEVGGDPFDLADLGLDKVRYIRIRDLAIEGAAPTAGFDLDAIGAIHLTP